jgi:hypothetical protein
MILNLRLQREGYVVFTAEGGRAALEIDPPRRAAEPGACWTS